MLAANWFEVWLAKGMVSELLERIECEILSDSNEWSREQ